MRNWPSGLAALHPGMYQQAAQRPFYGGQLMGPGGQPGPTMGQLGPQAVTPYGSPNLGYLKQQAMGGWPGARTTPIMPPPGDGREPPWLSGVGQPPRTGGPMNPPAPQPGGVPPPIPGTGGFFPRYRPT